MCVAAIGAGGEVASPCYQLKSGRLDAAAPMAENERERERERERGGVGWLGELTTVQPDNWACAYIARSGGNSQKMK